MLTCKRARISEIDLSFAAMQAFVGSISALLIITSAKTETSREEIVRLTTGAIRGDVLAELVTQ
jgi:hypothetical protein